MLRRNIRIEQPKASIAGLPIKDISLQNRVQSRSPLHVIYFDPESTGYHPGHVRIFAERAALDDRIAAVHFVLAPSFPSRDHTGVLQNIAACNKFSVEYCSEHVESAASATSTLRGRDKGKVRWEEVRQILQRHPRWVLFDSMLDLTLLGAALDRRPVKGTVTGTVHFCASALSNEKMVKKWRQRLGYLLAKRPEIPVVLSFDRIFVEKGPRYIVNNWRWIPDPLPLNAQQFARLNSVPRPTGAKSRVEFLLFGSLGLRKGLFSILQAAQLLGENAATRTSIHIIGKYTEGTEAEKKSFEDLIEVTRATNKVEVRYENRFASEDELIEALAACDVVLAPYLHHQGVSSVLIWAAAAGRPILTQNTGWIAQAVKCNNLGVVCDPSYPADVARAISEMVLEGYLDQWSNDAPRRFSIMHTADHFYDSVVQQLEYAGERQDAGRSLASSH